MKPDKRYHLYMGANRHDRRLGECAAFTLVETLLAVLLGSAAVATAAAVAVDVVGVRKHVDAKITAQWSRMRIGEAFATDLRNVLRRTDVYEPSIRLPMERERLIEIHCLALRPTTGSMFVRRLPALVTYRIADSDGPEGTKRLVRETRFLTEPGEAPQVETLARGLESVTVEVLRKSEWRATTSERESDNVPLRAARLKCRWVRNSKSPLVRTVVLDDDAPKS
jgi:hypothetical protein